MLAGKTEVAVINILSMPTHRMMSQKLLHQVRSSVLMQSDMCGPTLLMYPLIPRSVYKAKTGDVRLGGHWRQLGGGRWRQCSM